MLAFKAAAIVTLYLLFFGPDVRPDVTAEMVGRVLLAAPSPGTGD